MRMNRISKMAALSPIMIAIAILSGIGTIVLHISALAMIPLLALIASFCLGSLALFRIHLIDQTLRGSAYAISGIILSTILLIILLMYARLPTPT